MSVPPADGFFCRRNGHTPAGDPKQHAKDLQRFLVRVELFPKRFECFIDTRRNSFCVPEARLELAALGVEVRPEGF